MAERYSSFPKLQDSRTAASSPVAVWRLIQSFWTQITRRAISGWRSASGL